MSQYWKNMFIWNRKNNTNNLFISQDKPVFPINTSSSEVKVIASSNTKIEVHALSIFYSNNFRINNSEYTNCLTETDINNYLSINSEIVNLYNGPEIIGSIINILVPIEIGTELNKNINQYSDRSKTYGIENSHVFACSSYLILKHKYRNKGFGMKLIQESLQILHQHGGLGAYFVNRVSRCANSIELNWYILPLNLEKVEIQNFSFLKNFINYKSLFNGKIYQFNSIELLEQIKSIEDTKLAYDFYSSFRTKYKFYFAPKEEYWDKWIKIFPTYVIKKDNKLEALFCLNIQTIKNPQNQYIKYAVLLFYLGNMEYFKLIADLRKNIDYLLICELGNINKKIMEILPFQHFNRNYINFYNTNIKLKKEEILIPIF